MSTNQVDGKTKRTMADRQRYRRLREKFKHRPSQEELLATGDYEGPAPLGVFLEMRLAAAGLRRARLAASLSLAQVAERSGIDKAALSRLERGLQPNPTVDTLCRYAAALGKRLAWQLVDDPDVPRPLQTGTGSGSIPCSDEPAPLEESRRRLDTLMRLIGSAGLELNDLMKQLDNRRLHGARGTAKGKTSK
jgi:transcriptional regulator with XRE-family HTH domain